LGTLLHKHVLEAWEKKMLQQIAESFRWMLSSGLASVGVIELQITEAYSNLSRV